MSITFELAPFAIEIVTRRSKLASSPLIIVWVILIERKLPTLREDG